MQLGLIDKESEKIANTANINFIMNRCPKIEYAKFSGELGWAGVNSNVISNKRNLIKKMKKKKYHMVLLLELFIQVLLLNL